MAKIGSVTPFNPNGQAPGDVPANPLQQGPRKGVTSGGSKSTPQAHIGGNSRTKSSAPKSAQRLRG